MVRLRLLELLTSWLKRMGALLALLCGQRNLAREEQSFNTQALDDETARFANLVANLPGAVYRCRLDEHWTMEYLSDEIEVLSGYPVEDFLLNRVRTYASLIYPSDVSPVDQSVREAVRVGRPFEMEYRILTKSGEIRWVMERGRLFAATSSTKQVYLDGVIIDVSEKMRALQAYREQQEFINKVNELSPELILVFSTLEGRILFANDRVQTMLGYSKVAFCQLTIGELTELVHPEDRSELSKFYRQIIELKDAAVIENEQRMRRSSGEYIWVRQRVSVFRRDCFAQTIETLNVLEDITLQRQALQELEQQRVNASYIAKMASLGEMAGGIAHEINNPLAIILARTKQMEILLRREPVDIQRLQDSLQSMMQTSERITTIIRGLRSFARDGNQDPLVETSLAVILEESISLCESRLISLNISLEVCRGPEASALFLARPVQISQIILNLLSNASDAVQALPRPWIRLETFMDQSYIGLRVVDSGPGVPAALREKIMSPFFTTKAAGQGTGLGLSISRTIAVAHGGDLWLDSSAPHTSFVLSLPRQRDEQVQSPRNESYGAVLQ